MKIKINNNEYNIHFVEKSHEKLLMNDEEYHSGVTYFTDKEIYIRKDLNPHSLRYTLIHEITHALIDSYGFLQVDWNDEIVADFIGNHLPTIGEIYNKITDDLLKKGYTEHE